MRTLKTRLKTFAYFFIVIMLLQSCVAYHKASVSLEQAEQSKKMIKVKTNSNQTYRFNKIVLEEEQYYGLKKEKGEIVKIAISHYGTSEFFLRSKRKSTWATIGVIALPVSLLYFTALTLRNNLTFDSGLNF